MGSATHSDSGSRTDGAGLSEAMTAAAARVVPQASKRLWAIDSVMTGVGKRGSVEAETSAHRGDGQGWRLGVCVLSAAKAVLILFSASPRPPPSSGKLCVGCPSIVQACALSRHWLLRQSASRVALPLAVSPSPSIAWCVPFLLHAC